MLENKKSATGDTSMGGVSGGSVIYFKKKKKFNEINILLITSKMNKKKHFRITQRGHSRTV